MATRGGTADKPSVSARDASHIPRGLVAAETMFYCAPVDGSKPFSYPNEPPRGLPKRNFGDANMAIPMHDIWGQESIYNIDENGFETLKTDFAIDVNFTLKESIEEECYPEVERLLRKRLPKANRIVPFDYIVRPSDGNRPPVLGAHIGQSPEAAIGRVRAILPDEAEELPKGCVRIINIWRPSSGSIQRNPLAYADSKAVSEDEMVRVEHLYTERVSATLSAKYATSQRWYYWSGIEHDERLLLVCYDGEKGIRVPHSVFVDPRTPEDALPR